MSEGCIGVENKDSIRNLEEKITLLKQEVKHMKENMVTITGIHEFQLEISKLRGDITEQKNNRIEDRNSIKALSSSLAEVSSILEEYLSGNAKVLANQIVAKSEQDILKDSVHLILTEIKSMKLDIRQSGVISQFKIFYNTNKLTKWIGRLGLLSLGIFIVSVFAFFTSGGKTFYEILNNLKEWII